MEIDIIYRYRYNCPWLCTYLGEEIRQRVCFSIFGEIRDDWGEGKNYYIVGSKHGEDTIPYSKTNRIELAEDRDISKSEQNRQTCIYIYI